MSKIRYEQAWPDNKIDDTFVEELGLAGSGWYENNAVRICEFWEMKSRPKIMLLGAQGNIIMVDTAEEIRPLFEQNKLYIDPRTSQPRMREGWQRYACMHLITGTEILAGPYELPINRLPIIRVEGRVVRVGDDRYRYGLVRWAKDPARMRNYWRSVAVEKLAMAPKAKWLAEDEAVQGYEEDFRNAHISQDSLLKYKRGMKEPKQIDPPRLDAAVFQEIQMNTQDIKDTTGLHDASLGIRSNEVSGVAIGRRQQEGDVATVVYHDNLNAAIQEGGDVIQQLIPVCYDTTREMLYVGEDEKEKLLTINDPEDPDTDMSRGKYTTVVETGPSFTTQRQEGAQAMMEMIKVAPDVMTLAADLIAKYQDFPGAMEIAERLRKSMVAKGIITEEGEEGPQELTPQIAEQIKEQALKEFMESVQGQTLQAELELKQVELRRAEAEAEKAEHEAELADLEVDKAAALAPSEVKRAAIEAEKAGRPEPRPSGDKGTGSGASRREARPQPKRKGPKK